MKGHVDEHVHVHIVPNMLTELLYPLQYGGGTLAAMEGHTTCVKHLLSTPDIDVNIKNEVSWSTEYKKKHVRCALCYRNYI